ncbi:MAG: caspase family protein [Syntrophales bacterium]
MMLDRLTVPGILSVILVLFLASCASTPDIRLSTADMTMELKENAYRVSSLAVSHDGRYVASGDVNGDVALWDIQNGKMKWKVNGHGITGPATNDNWVWSASFTPDGRNLLTGGGNRVIKLWDTETGTLRRILEGHEGSRFTGNASVNSIVVSADGRTAVTAGGDGTVGLWDIEKGIMIKRLKANESWGGRGMVLAADMSPDGKYSVSSDGNDTIMLWDNETGQALLKKQVNTDMNERWLNSIVFAKNGMWAISGGANLRYWDLRTGKLLKKIKEEGGAEHLSLSKDGKMILASGYKLISLRDVDSGQLIRSYQGGKGGIGLSGARIFNAAIFHPNGKWIVTKGIDASVRIKDMDTDEEIALFVGFSDGEWIVVTSEGYYNSSEKGAQYLKVNFEGADYTVDQFYDVFYRPDIVAAKLSGQDVSGLISITMKDARKSPPPLVEFTSHTPGNDQQKAKVCYRVKSAGGGIGEVRLFHNGKLIQSDGYYREVAKSISDKTQLTSLNGRSIYADIRNLTIKDKTDSTLMSSKSKGDLFEDCKEIDAIPGENEVSVSAFNGTNTVQSYMKTVTFDSKRKQENPHLYILSIGIDQYNDSNVNLKYAVKDAKDLEERIKAQSATLYKSENIHYSLLSDNEATKTNITGKINELSRIIKPQDSFILFVAGHGVLLQNQYYMLTHDFNGQVGDTTMISSNEIVEMSKKIMSLSQLFIFDTCHAGGVDTIVSGLYDARMSVLAKKMGLHIYASANSKEVAIDGYKGNGLFTYTLLDGLNNNKQADKYKDGKVSIVGLGEYSKKMTTSISRQIGHEQTPLIINFGKDSPIYKLQ